MEEKGSVKYTLSFLTGQKLAYEGPPDFKRVQAFLQENGYHKDETRIIFCGKQYNQTMPMPQSGSWLHIVLKLRGGGGCIASQTDFQSGLDREKV